MYQSYIYPVTDTFWVLNFCHPSGEHCSMQQPELPLILKGLSNTL